MLPKTAYWNIWEHPRNFVTKENKSENANVTCKCHLLINISHRVIFDMWHIRDIQYVLLLSLSTPPTFSKVIILFHTAQKMKFSIKDLFSKFDQSTGNCRPGHITEEIMNRKLICAYIQCPISLYQGAIVCFLTRIFFPDNSHILGPVFSLFWLCLAACLRLLSSRRQKIADIG